MALKVKATSLILALSAFRKWRNKSSESSSCSLFHSLLFLLFLRVLDELPAANMVLLQHLLCVLHHILQSADTNKMDAHNLAVCIGPTLLQLDGAPLNEQKDRIEKVGHRFRYDCCSPAFVALKLCGRQRRKPQEVSHAGFHLLHRLSFVFLYAFPSSNGHAGRRKMLLAWINAVDKMHLFYSCSGENQSIVLILFLYLIVCRLQR